MHRHLFHTGSILRLILHVRKHSLTRLHLVAVAVTGTDVSYATLRVRVVRDYLPLRWIYHQNKYAHVMIKLHRYNTHLRVGVSVCVCVRVVSLNFLIPNQIYASSPLLIHSHFALVGRQPFHILRKYAFNTFLICFKII